LSNHGAPQRQCRCDGRPIMTIRRIHVTAAEDAAEARIPTCRSPVCRSIRSPPGQPRNVSDLVTNGTRVRSTRHQRQSEASRRCDVVPILLLLAIDSLAFFNAIPRYAVLSNFPSASPRCHVSILQLQVCSRRLAVNLRSHDYFRCEQQNSDEYPSSQTVESVHIKLHYR
jgi:hypothetical protein